MRVGSARAFSSSTGEFMALAPDAVAATMKDNGTRRACVVLDTSTGSMKASHEFMQPLADFMNNDKTDFLGHEAVFLEVGEESDLLMGAFLWKTVRGQGCGGVRLLPYDSFEGYVRDGMRLALGMGRKSALAGLWWGGGKGVVARNDSVTDSNRAGVFRDYGRFLTSLRGCYVGAEDAGVCVDDVDVVFSKTRHTTCISPALGGSGNPSVPTAAGVVAAMEGALSHLDMGDLTGKSVAVQGAGNVGFPMIGFLLGKGVSKVIAVDKDPKRVQDLHDAYGDSGRVQASSDGLAEILFHDVDIVSPCGFGAILNKDSIPNIKARIVCGAANNQLAEHADGARVNEAGICYVPDFVANRMGIVNCANEQYGRIGAPDQMIDPAITRHFDSEWENSVANITKSVLQTAKEQGTTTADAANLLADKAADEPHPIWGHRPRAIIDSLVEDGWAYK